MSIAVSILVPICNVERYLEKCLNSLISQTIKNIEIICINDGSTDNSLTIIKKYAQKDKRIVLINKTNTGYGDSMNQGLKVVKGEYIGIVESDDFIDNAMYEDLYNIALKYKADIVKSSFYEYWEKPEKIKYSKLFNDKDINVNTEENRKVILKSPPSIWTCVYKKELIFNNNIKFLATPGAAYQDTSFHFKTICLAKNIVITAAAYLYYRQDNSNSSVKIATMNKVLSLHKEMDEIKKFIYTNNMECYLPLYYALRINKYIWNYNRMSVDDREDYMRLVYNEICADKHFKDFKYNFLNLSKFKAVVLYIAIKISNKTLLDYCLKGV